jgi:ketosteroid isomerase-like protein
MREEDLEALRRGYEAWNHGDVESVLGLVHPEMAWSPGEEAPEAGRFTGRDGFAAFITSWSESFDEFRLEPEEMTAVGDCVIVVLRQSGRGAGSGIELDIRTVHVWTIRDGQAVAWAGYRNREQALAAIG